MKTSVIIQSLFTLGIAPYTISNYAGIFKDRFSKKLTSNEKKLGTDNWSWKKSMPTEQNRFLTAGC